MPGSGLLTFPRVSPVPASVVVAAVAVLLRARIEAFTLRAKSSLGVSLQRIQRVCLKFQIPSQHVLRLAF